MRIKTVHIYPGTMLPLIPVLQRATGAMYTGEGSSGMYTGDGSSNAYCGVDDEGSAANSGYAWCVVKFLFVDTFNTHITYKVSPDRICRIRISFPVDLGVPCCTARTTDSY